MDFLYLCYIVKMFEDAVGNQNNAEAPPIDQQGGPSLLASLLKKREALIKDEKIWLEGIRLRGAEVYSLIADENLPNSERIVDRGTITEIIEALREEDSRLNRRPTVSKLTSEMNSVCLKIPGELAVVAISANADNGQIAHELFHANLEDTFLSAENKKLLEEVGIFMEDVFMYGRYLENRTEISGEEMRLRDYFARPHEAMGALIQEYVNFVSETEDANYRGTHLLDKLRYGQRGPALAEQILTAYEHFIEVRHKGKPFSLKLKTEFIASLKEKPEQPLVSSQIAASQESQRTLSEVLKSLPSEVSEVLLMEHSKTIEESIARAMTMAYSMPNVLDRLTCFENVFTILSNEFKRIGRENLYKLLNISSLDELQGIEWDDARHEVYYTPTASEPVADEDVVALWQKLIEEEKENLVSQSQQPPKLSFEEFIGSDAQREQMY